MTEHRVRALRRVRGRASFVLALVVLAVALVIGSGVTSSATPDAARRAAALETQIRCPSCEDVSVAQSSAASAIAVRHEVQRLAAAGVSDHAIEQRLVAQYGPSILLSPPDSGLSSLVWLLPLVAGLLAVGGLGVFFWRRSRSWRELRAGAPG
ncbi:MAG: cytochrome c-type biogenesis protein CcmH [Actinomycetota bacterium]|jgi:cytochrome c-type biogenesis protein CcmH|nr:cytochrome c-type biogenesis protein CcmH [Actinomycetota bacterium]